MNRYITGVAAAAVLAGATLAGAQTLYKLIDKNGKVTYSETAPKDFPGQVIRIDIDPNRNTATLPKPKEAEAAGPREGGKDVRTKGPPPDDAPNVAGNNTVEAARERLEAAKKALADAQQNPGEGELTWVGKVGGGARPIPTDGYAARLMELDRAVKAAEEELRRADGR
jgi:hypothetical protein